ncbi:peptide deformylase [Candidatus Giovannonibacteria bacterium RIFCSPLOWO2_02_FULL_43_11b]|uniref:Peptide deformylase n=1 Tax=Candidatus Giovannonibacteria bacterium RIFCSPHIGHO2_12_FULL_43_15 TaxID=1798341 RepID=A0A1F5WQB5_9BACT|nr:MAG: peptide deformylase [Candidatus Giovannonibacteria bacterium RIFCSPHIGHO2_01_FULL_43_100]OGF67306.1 MAG: peptide deformylase [Candidatus Giovannonibacteria bacterium RIFCSPHIGHO2_02_FULL_43_32]OGF77794.1 MAG: peptide deformylase [Candidatus Giovannonibacteria bacterium RIFCSPHIGHO2_12_FULL_43_15]OGF78587.1 MAG: peptide deformylase [Candidatus Giovannonibacteria bacterium RIFCSPLOWO2_01_FULL_43_60]OGF90024.1 MAG: peptide deformylase [Candidatus Giovannonibacteria bacterium RIFCSPLOWO2_02
MAILRVLQEPEKTLRQVAKGVPPDEIKSGKIQELIRDMSDTLHSIDIGIGLAAPQTGYSLRIFIISEEAKVVKRDENKVDRVEYKKHKAERKWKHFVFINPKLIRISEEKHIVPEGCLSVDKIFGEVKRSKRAVIEAYNESGKKFRRSASGLFAQAMQHETDHLNGVLFIDTAVNLKKLEDLETEEK